MKNVSIFAGHDANIAFADTDNDTYHVIEIERLVKKRYFRLHVDNSMEDIYAILSACQNVAKQYFGMDDEYDVFSMPADGGLIPLDLIQQIFPFKEMTTFDHHRCHAASTFYQSPFKRSLIISYDGGGNDGFFNVYLGDSDGINFLKNIKCDFGGGYLLLGSCCEEIGKSSRHQLALAGKFMGLGAYGDHDEEVISAMKPFFIDKDYKKLSDALPYDLKNADCPWQNPLENYKFSDKDSFDFAASAQLAYEAKFLELFDDILKEYPLTNVCLTGGGALNVLLNQTIKNNYDVETFVSPNPNDGGLALGSLFLTTPPKKQVNIAYNGLPLLDADKESEYLKDRKTSPLDLDYVCKLLKEGKIIGVCRGDSEVGPRALGNRSIVCDPSFKDMKDILNAKVKFREWFRPFAPFCLKDEAHKYFESADFENLEFMSYAPMVREEFQESLPSITHIDGTSRLQTVTEDSHQFFHDLLKTFSKYSDINVLLNTSFNIRGNPILSTIEDALHVLDNTELDCVIINDTLVEK